MKIHLIRNATLILEYANHKILIDPDFAPKHSRRSFTGKSPNPMVDLPLPPEKILKDIEAVFVSHLHEDHFDKVAKISLPKSIQMYCQPTDEPSLKKDGFVDLHALETELNWNGIQITRTDGHHGEGEVGEMMGVVSGFVFKTAGEPTLYWAGDTVLCDVVKATIETHQPDVIITHSCGATWPDSSDNRQLIVMDAAQTIEVCQLAENATVIATHMDALDHSTISREDLRKAAKKENISDKRLQIPADGKIIEIS